MRRFSRALLTSQGIGLLSVLIGACLVAGALTVVLPSLVKERRMSADMYQKILAEAYAAELAEFFRSFTPDALKSYLGANPITGGVPYRLCSHINLLDRANTTTVAKILNGDPLAALPSFNPLAGPSPQLDANRFYQVWVMDMRTGLANNSYCNRTMQDIRLYGRAGPEPTQLLEQELFIVSVGVSWVPRGRSVSDVRRIVLNTVIPRS